MSCRLSLLRRAVCLFMRFTHLAVRLHMCIFSFSLHMAHVSFARSHLYFDSLHLMTHFFCLTHSAVRILISNSYKAACQLKKKKKENENEKAGSKNKWDCYVSWNLEQRFKPSPSPTCAARWAETRLFTAEREPGRGSGTAPLNALDSAAAIHISCNHVRHPRAIFFLP